MAWGVHEVFMIGLFWNSDGWLACVGSYYSRTQEDGGMFIYFDDRFASVPIEQ
jgi:hypothetical protein